MRLRGVVRHMAPSTTTFGSREKLRFLHCPAVLYYNPGNFRDEQKNPQRIIARESVCAPLIKRDSSGGMPAGGSPNRVLEMMAHLFMNVDYVPKARRSPFCHMAVVPCYAGANRDSQYMGPDSARLWGNVPTQNLGHVS